MRIVHGYMRLMLGALAVAFALGACAPLATQPAPPSVGTPAPAFELPLLHGGAIRLADLKGKVVIINFWASWCGPCVAETPRLVEWYGKHRAEGLEVLGVDVLFRDSRADVEAFTKANQVPYPVPIDEQGTITAQWLAQQLPRSYVLDRTGVVRFVRIGELTEDDFAAQVVPLLQTDAQTGRSSDASLAHSDTLLIRFQERPKLW
jgi:thiol-disulfide isomerase/thioredoxin